MSDGVGESHRFPPIDGLHDRCCNISNERCRRAPLEFIKSPSPRSAKPASALSLSCHCILLFSNFSFAKTLYLNRFSISRYVSSLHIWHIPFVPASVIYALCLVPTWGWGSAHMLYMAWPACLWRCLGDVLVSGMYTLDLLLTSTQQHRSIPRYTYT